MAEKYVNPLEDPNDQDALAAAIKEVDTASAYMQAEGIGSDEPPENMIDKTHVDKALQGGNPPSDQEEDD